MSFAGKPPKCESAETEYALTLHKGDRMSDEGKIEIEPEPDEAVALDDQAAEGGETLEAEGAKLPEPEQPPKSHFERHLEYERGYNDALEVAKVLRPADIQKLLTRLREQPTTMPDKTLIVFLGFSNRLYNALKRMVHTGGPTVSTLGDLARLSEADILEGRNLGPGAVEEIRAVLEYCGRTLAESQEPEEPQSK